MVAVGGRKRDRDIAACRYRAIGDRREYRRRVRDQNRKAALGNQPARIRDAHCHGLGAGIARLPAEQAAGRYGRAIGAADQRIGQRFGDILIVAGRDRQDQELAAFNRDIAKNRQRRCGVADDRHDIQDETPLVERAFGIGHADCYLMGAASGRYPSQFAGRR